MILQGDPGSHICYRCGTIDTEASGRCLYCISCIAGLMQVVEHMGGMLVAIGIPLTFLVEGRQCTVGPLMVILTTMRTGRLWDNV
jgi:prepilin signal peptidase PulO-like enzyme (type II secretory pathway)